MIPITKRAHAQTSASKSPLCPSCKIPIGKVGTCSCTFIHRRGAK